MLLDAPPLQAHFTACLKNQVVTLSPTRVLPVDVNMSSLWNDVAEWTEFGSNALFAPNQEESAPKEDEQPRGRRQERPKEELRVLSKSPNPKMRQNGRERRLRPKSLEPRTQLEIGKIFGCGTRWLYHRFIASFSPFSCFTA